MGAGDDDDEAGDHTEPVVVLHIAAPAPALPSAALPNAAAVLPAPAPAHHDGSQRGRKKEIVDKGFLREGDSTVIVESGKGVWFVGADLVQQTRKTLLIFDALYPDADALFVFDNASGHAAYSSDALLVERMNLGQCKIGDAVLMRDGWYMQDGNRVVQRMVRDGVNIGIRAALQERGLWTGNLKLHCSEKKDPGGKAKKVKCAGSGCCASQLLAAQPDFQEQECALVQLVKEHNQRSGKQHIVDFLPKFHPELNPIERVWAALKFYCRENCTYSAGGLRRLIPTALDKGWKPEAVGHYYRKCLRFAEAYDRGFSYSAAEFASRKYKSHRGLPSEATLEKIEAELTAAASLRAAKNH